METSTNPVEIAVDTSETGAEVAIDARVRDAAEAAIKAADATSELKPIDWDKTNAMMAEHSSADDNNR